MKTALLITEASVFTNNEGKLQTRGGAAKYFHTLAKTLLELGIQPTVLAIREFPEQKAEEIIEGVNYQRMAIKSRTSPKLINYLRKAIKLSKNFDCVFTNQFTPNLILPWLKNEKIIAILHDTYQPHGYKLWRQNYGKIIGTIAHLIEKIQLWLVSRYATKVITVSQASKIKLSTFINPDKIHVCPHPVQPSSSKTPKEKHLLFIGRLVAYKNPDHFLHVLHKIRKKDAQFTGTIIAPSAETKTIHQLEKLAAKLEITDHLDFKFGLSDKAVSKLLQKSQILVHPSNQEGQGLVILEALANKTPVAAYNLPAYESMLQDKSNSRVAPLNDHQALAKACQEIIDNIFQYQKNCDYDIQSLSNDAYKERLTTALN